MRLSGVSQLVIAAMLKSFSVNCPEVTSEILKQLMQVANGENVKVIQETYAGDWLAHIEVYSQACYAEKRAQQRLSCKGFALKVVPR